MLGFLFMSVATDSPVNSSSSDDFLALLDAELDSGSSDKSVDQDCEDEEAADTEGARMKRRKVDCEVEVQGSTSYVATEQTIDGAIEDSCPHPGFLKDMCIRCGKRIDDGAGVAFGYIHKDLRLANDEISRLRNTDVRTLLRRKKLYLVLDLDHTLLNSTRLDDMNLEEEYLKVQTDSLQDISKGSLFRLDMMRMMTKLRPFVRTFLQEASKMFEMYIYTMGERPYAIEMAKLLDPGSMYFNSRVISQADCTQRHQKGLDVVMGQESAVLILDDTEAVLKQIRKEVLKDCKLVFSRVFPTKSQAANHHLWKIAEQLGATCSIELDSSVTHVVSTDAGTEKSRWATQNGSF
ncbi:RNA polymerase II C-terminal domain phosphatase-like 4 [Bienertia sinuspersici]